jgi:hypothetical protein
MKSEGGKDVLCVCVGGLAVSADSVFFGAAGKAAAKSGSERDGTRDGQTRTQEQPRAMSEGDPELPNGERSSESRRLVRGRVKAGPRPPQKERSEQEILHKHIKHIHAWFNRQ